MYKLIRKKLYYMGIIKAEDGRTDAFFSGKWAIYY